MIVAVKKPHVNKVAPAESFAMTKGEITTEGREQGFTILGTNFAALFKFHDVMANLPSGFGNDVIDRLQRSALS